MAALLLVCHTLHRFDGFRKDVEYLVELLVGGAVRGHENDRVANRTGQHAALAHLRADPDAHAVGQRIWPDFHRADKPDLAHIHDMRQFAATIQARLKSGDLWRTPASLPAPPRSRVGFPYNCVRERMS